MQFTHAFFNFSKPALMAMVLIMTSNLKLVSFFYKIVFRNLSLATSRGVLFAIIILAVSAATSVPEPIACPYLLVPGWCIVTPSAVTTTILPRYTWARLVIYPCILLSNLHEFIYSLKALQNYPFDERRLLYRKYVPYRSGVYLLPPSMQYALPQIKIPFFTAAIVLLRAFALTAPDAPSDFTKASLMLK